MRQQTAHFNLDFQIAAEHLRGRGFRTNGALELLNYNLTLANPRNRVLSFPKIGTDTPRLWSTGFQAVYSALTDEADDFLLAVSKSKNPNAESALFLNQGSPLLSGDAISRTFLLREGRLHLIYSAHREHLFETLPSTVFRETMRQEALLTRLRQALPNIELGGSFFNINLLSVDEHDPRLDFVLIRDRVFDLEMIPMDRLDTSTDVNDGTEYWKTFKAAFVGDDEAAIHKIFGQEED